MDLFLIQWIYFRLFIVVNQFLRKWTIRPSLPEIPVTMDIPPPPPTAPGRQFSVLNIDATHLVIGVY